MSLHVNLRLALLAAALILGAGAIGAWMGQGEPDALPPLPLRPTGVHELLFAQPFVLDQGYTHSWRAEQPQVTAGYVLALAVDPDLAYPRETAASVLYVGDQTAEHVNHGYPSGRLVVLVPAPVDAQGLPVLDLEHTPIWFGSPALPEEVDAATIRQELTRALADGIQPPTQDEVQRALDAGGGLFAAADRTTLERHAAQLVLQLAPDERELAEGLLVPLVGR